MRLGEIADVRIVQAPIAIKRDAVSRYVDVEAGVSGRSLDSVAAELEERLQGVGVPAQVPAEVLTEITGAEINSSMMLGAALAVALAALLLMQAAFRSWRLAALVFLALPVAPWAEPWRRFADGAERPLGAALGLLAVFGAGGEQRHHAGLSLPTAEVG